MPGKYVAPGVIFTTRGCPNKCGFCFVPKREGEFRELPIVAGNVVQDNNILACSERHWDALMMMLKGQHGIKFSGGLEARRLTDKRIADLRGLRIENLFLACDSTGALPAAVDAIRRLTRAGFTRSHIYVYVICGKDEEEETARMEQLYLAGGSPFAQLFQPEERIDYSREWKRFATKWSRPAAFVSNMEYLFKI